MGGTNPYIEKTDYELPQKPYTVTYIAPSGVTTKVEVDPAKIPYGPTGLPGSLLDIAMGNGVDLEHVLRRSLCLLDLPRDRQTGTGHL